MKSVARNRMTLVWALHVFMTNFYVFKGDLHTEPTQSKIFMARQKRYRNETQEKGGHKTCIFFDPLLLHFHST